MNRGKLEIARNQNGATTSLPPTSVLLSERDHQSRLKRDQTSWSEENENDEDISFCQVPVGTD